MSETLSEPSKPKRHRLQFSLRTMFIVTTIAAVVLGFISRPIMERRREQAILETLGFQNVSAGYQYVPAPGDSLFSIVLGSATYERVQRLTLGGTMSKDVDPGRLAKLKYLRVLKLANTQVGDAELAGLRQLSGLEELDLSGTQVTDAGLVNLEGLKKLRQLHLAGTEVTYEALRRLQAALPAAEHLVQCRAAEEIERAGGHVQPHGKAAEQPITEVQFLGRFADADLAHLAWLPELKRLRILHRATDASLKHIEGLTGLEELDLNYSDITNDGLSCLSGLTNLKMLKLDDTLIDDAGLVHLTGLSHLRELDLSRTRITGLGLEQLTNFELLEVLNLNGVPYIYDIDLGPLKEMKTLRKLGLDDARLSEKGVASLRAALRSAVIEMPTDDRESNTSLGPPATIGLPAAGAEAFWDGDYDKMVRVFQEFVSSPGAAWQGHLWLGHAHELAGRWPEAVAAYKAALGQLDREIRDVSGSPQDYSQESLRRQLCEARAKLVLLTGRIELFELEDPAASIQTLSAGLRYAPKAYRPIEEIAADAAKAVEGLKNVYSSRRTDDHLWSELMYPLAAHRHLAMAHERLGNIEAALDCWTRIRLCRLAYRASQAQVDVTHVAELWAELPADRPLPPMPIFVKLSPQRPEVTLKRASGSSRLTCWESNDWDTLAIVPPPGSAVASLQITCLGSSVELKPAVGATLRCWVGNERARSGASQILLEHRWPKGIMPYPWGGTFYVDVRYDADIVFLRTSCPEINEITLRAELRPRGKGQPMPEPTPSRFRRFKPPSESPFHMVGPVPEFRDTPPSKYDGAALVELPDGRLLAASSKEKIFFSTSSDGKTWEDSWEFAHNSVFNTGGPALLVDDDGVIWMAYASKRPHTDHFSSGHFCLWITHSRDGHNWSMPKPVRTGGWPAPRRPVQMTRGPGGRYWIFLDGRAGSGRSPGDVKQLRRINVPVRHETVAPANAHATFDQQGRCHLVFDDFGLGRTSYYSRSDEMTTWSALVKLNEKEDRSRVTHAQLVLHGNRVALLYTNTAGMWLRRGPMTAEGPELAEPIQLADSSQMIPGARLLRTGDKVFLPVLGDPLRLLVADVDELVGRGDLTDSPEAAATP
ncbi:MAG: hypothetical protein V3R99_08780 [Thermoguttaceae bacterium]